MLDDKRSATAHDGRESSKRHCFHSFAAKSVLPAPPCPSGPSVVDESLITVANNIITSGLYLYDLDAERVGGGEQQRVTFVQIDFRQKLVKFFYSGRKAINTQMDLTYKEINFKITLFEASSEV